MKINYALAKKKKRKKLTWYLFAITELNILVITFGSIFIARYLPPRKNSEGS